MADQAKKESIQVLAGRCQPHGKNIPLFPWLDILTSWLGLDKQPDTDDQYTHLATTLMASNLSSFIDPLAQVLLGNFLAEPVNQGQIIFHFCKIWLPENRC